VNETGKGKKPLGKSANYPRLSVFIRGHFCVCLFRRPYPLASDSIATSQRVVSPAKMFDQRARALQPGRAGWFSWRALRRPERDIPDVLVRLERAACSVGKTPHQLQMPSEAYRQLADAWEQLGRQDEIGE
jgi:hypothetical protein